MNDLNSPKPVDQQAKDAANTAASKAQDVVRSAQQTTNSAIGKVADKVDEVKSNVKPMVDKASDQAADLVQYGKDLYSDTSQLVRDKAAQATDIAVGFAKDEPLKALLIAAAAGAVAMSILVSLARSRD